jgi:trehalose synthase
MTGLCAAAIGIRDPYNMSSEDKNLIRKMHILILMFNAMQPGVLALSGWDLIGALPLPIESAKDLIEDKDYRWLNRGAYDLMGIFDEAHRSKFGIPKAYSLYGSLPHQLNDEKSFASQLKKLLNLRKNYRIAFADQIAVPNVKNPSVLIMVHSLPDDLGIEITALNFGHISVSEKIKVAEICPEIKDCRITDLLDGSGGDFSIDGEVVINLGAWEGKILLIRNDRNG